MKRREFIFGFAATALILPQLMRGRVTLASELNSNIFNKIVSKARSEHWNELPISKIMGKVALQFLDTPYRGGTLEINNTEKCVIELSALDCVTFFENTLGLARIIKLEEYSLAALINQVTYTRYRNGKIEGYTSRLHYTSDWIYDNVKKGTVEDISESLSGSKISFNLTFMSKHPQYYKQLKNNPDLIKRMRQIEEEINTRTYYYIPKNKVATIENRLQTGDIIAIVNTAKGLDYSHTGLIYKKNGKAHFMHASSVKKKVIIDKTIWEYLKHSKRTNKGITVLRPLEP